MKLSEVCEFIIDCPHSTAVDEGLGYPLIRTPNVGNGRLILEGVHRVSEETYNKRNARAVPQAGDLIFAREAPAGNVALIQEGQEVCLGQRTVLIRPNADKVDAAFLTYYILAPEQQYHLLGSANGATVAHVNLPIIRNLEINIPDILTQQRISNILTAYDDLIENNQKQIKLLEEAAQRLYKEWFVDFRFPGHEKTKIIDGVPEGWGRGPLKDIAVFVRGKTITSGDVRTGNVPVIAGGMEPAYYHDKSNTVAPVVTVSGSGANAGFTNIYYENIWASDCSFIDINSTKYPYYIFCLLKTNKRIIDNLQKGSAQPHVYAKDLNDVLLMHSDNALMDIFEGTVTPMFEKIKCSLAEIKYLKETRNRLLPKLMNGEIEVQ